MKSQASAVWEGDLMSGKGRTTAATGAFKDLHLSWKARTEGGPITTPEELLASAHASCFSMALSHGLATGGKPATRLETTCVVEFGPKAGGGGFEVKSSALEVKGTVPGMDAAAFQKAAEDAKTGCPMSGALKIPMTVKASLA